MLLLNAGGLVIVATAQHTGSAMMKLAKNVVGCDLSLSKIRTFVSKLANFLKLPDVV